MVICDSAEQARQMFEIFNAIYAAPSASTYAVQDSAQALTAATKPESYAARALLENRAKSAALILHDVGNKEERKQWVEDFKAGKIDLLFVYNMLLTGFDAKRLKKLYLGRVIRSHNLLQALTRVNRTYKDFRYGYVVDFADIRKEFDATNKAYFDELQAELGDEVAHYSNLFKSTEEIAQEIEAIKDILFSFDIENAEIFSRQISLIQDRSKVLALKKALGDARNLYNLIRLQGDNELLLQLDFQKLNQLYRETSNHLDLLNLKESLESSADNSNLLNIALEDVLFMFTKVKEEELVLADKLKNTLRRTREALVDNFDQQDPKFITLKEELERLFKKKKLNEVSQEEMTANIGALNAIYDKVRELNRQNNQLRAKYRGDAKYTRIHKRLQERGMVTQTERRLFEALFGVKQQADEQVLQNTQLLSNESYFGRMMMPIVLDEFETRQKIDLNLDAADTINHLVVNEYMNEFASAGLLGSCAIVPESGVYLHNQRLGLISTDPSELDAGFVYYLFQTKPVREQIRLTSTGSKVKHTSPERIYAVTAALPKVEEQRKIAAVLSAIDAKIDCNNRINAELEAMVKMLYDYWFTQFDFPDANGKPYKSSGGRMVYSSVLKRKVPAGWEDGTLDDLGRIVGGSTPSTENPKHFTDSGTPWITPNDLSVNQGSKFITRGAQDVSDEGIKDASLKKAPAGTVLLRETLIN
jgi:restriction endonuclease S subunit/superfamily II DNA or RNA helicase